MLRGGVFHQWSLRIPLTPRWAGWTRRASQAKQFDTARYRRQSQFMKPASRGNTCPRPEPGAGVTMGGRSPGKASVRSTQTSAARFRLERGSGRRRAVGMHSLHPVLDEQMRQPQQINTTLGTFAPVRGLMTSGQQRMPIAGSGATSRASASPDRPRNCAPSSSADRQIPCQLLSGPCCAG